MPSEPVIVAHSPEGFFERPVAIAASDDGYLLVLARDSGSGVPQAASLFALRLDRALQPLDAEPIELTTAELVRAPPSVADDGEAWLLAWQEHSSLGSWDIRGARVPHLGGEIHAFNVAVSALDELAPTIAANSPGHAWVAYERFDDDPSAMIGRLFLREITGEDACDAECCGACPEQAPTAEECVVREHASTCGEQAAKRARYGCGCGVVGASGGAVGPWALLVMAAFAGLLGRRARCRRGVVRRERARALAEDRPRAARDPYVQRARRAPRPRV